MKQKTIYTIGGAILALSLGYFGYKLSVAQKRKIQAIKGNTLDLGETNGSVDNNTQPSQGAKESRDSLPLNVGSYGYKVQLLQSALNKLGASLTVDGKLGDKTYISINNNGGLPIYTWNSGCEIGNVCSLNKSNYDEILANATKQGWIIKNAQDLASDSWLPFVQDGDDYAFNNLSM